MRRQNHGFWTCYANMSKTWTYFPPAENQSMVVTYTLLPKNVQEVLPTPEELQAELGQVHVEDEA